MRKVRPPRTRTNDPANMRSRILDAAADLFHRRGYSETSMHEIMREALVTGGALHHHYPTKRDLGIAVIRERIAKMVDEAWIAPVLEADKPVEGVGNALRGIVKDLGKPIIGCPLNNLALELANSDPEFRKEIQAVFDSWRDALAVRFAQSKQLLRKSGLTPEELATFVVASYSGAMTLAKSAQSAEPLNVTLKFLTNMWGEGQVGPQS